MGGDWKSKLAKGASVSCLLLSTSLGWTQEKSPSLAPPLLLPQVFEDEVEEVVVPQTEATAQPTQAGAAEKIAPVPVPPAKEYDAPPAPEGVVPAPQEAQVMVPPPAPPAPAPAAPKKKVPPVFPGPKVLPPTGPYKPLYFDNDFSYKSKPDHDYVFGEELKNLEYCIADTEVVFSTGGELRHRCMNEDNRLRPGGPIQADNQLWRWRHYMDLKVGDRIRGYVEGIHAQSFGEDAPVQAIDENRWDLLNAFVDVKLFELDGNIHNVRYGRQEMLFGRQRFTSPLDWANTRRNFEGGRYWIKGEKFRFDAFHVNPVNSATGFRPVAVYDSRYDQANYDVHFSGTYFTYTGWENRNLDAYWFWLDTEGQDVLRPDGNRHTVGTRYSQLFPIIECGQTARVWDLDLEAAYQGGLDNGQAVEAGFATAIIGHTWKQPAWTPRISGLFYYGSGDLNRTDGLNNTVQVPFPLGHAYWALSDNLGGQNLINYSIQGEIKPTSKTSLVAAWHNFSLASGQDRAYNVAGAPVGTPGNGTGLGNAFDIYSYYAFNPNFDIQMGNSWFFYGNFIQNTTPRGDARQFYIQTSFRY